MATDIMTLGSRQRMSLPDLVIVIEELKAFLIGSRVNNIYDNTSRDGFYTFKLTSRSVPHEKFTVALESGWRIHRTWYKRPTGVDHAHPSGFTMKLRKHLRNTVVRDVCVERGDRVVCLAFGFESGANYFLVTECYGKGNVILMDADRLVLAALRPELVDRGARKVDSEKTAQINAETDGRNAISNVDPNRLIDTCVTTSQINQMFPFIKAKISTNDKVCKWENAFKTVLLENSSMRLRQALLRATFLGPVLIDHILHVAFGRIEAENGLQPIDLSTTCLAVLSHPSLLHSLSFELMTCATEIQGRISEPETKSFGFLYRKRVQIQESNRQEPPLSPALQVPDTLERMENFTTDDMMEKVSLNQGEYQNLNKQLSTHQPQETMSNYPPVVFSFLPIVHLKNMLIEERLSSLNHALDTYYTFEEIRNVESHREKLFTEAESKIVRFEREHRRRVQSLQKEEVRRELQALTIYQNMDVVESLLTVFREALNRRISWDDISRLVARRHREGDSLFDRLCRFNLEKREITLKLPYSDPGNENSEELSSATANMNSVLAEKMRDNDFLEITLSVDLNAYQNAQTFYDVRKKQHAKLEKTLASECKAAKGAFLASQKIQRKQTQIRKAPLYQRVSAWFEKFLWFKTSQNFLVVVARDKTQNELLWKRYVSKEDIVLLVDTNTLESTPSSTIFSLNRGHEFISLAVIKLSFASLGVEIGQDLALNVVKPMILHSLEEAAIFSACYSSMWDKKQRKLSICSTERQVVFSWAKHARLETTQDVNALEPGPGKQSVSNKKVSFNLTLTFTGEIERENIMALELGCTALCLPKETPSPPIKHRLSNENGTQFRKKSPVHDSSAHSLIFLNPRTGNTELNPATEDTKRILQKKGISKTKLKKIAKHKEQWGVNSTPEQPIEKNHVNASLSTEQDVKISIDMERNMNESTPIVDDHDVENNRIYKRPERLALNSIVSQNTSFFLSNEEKLFFGSSTFIIPSQESEAVSSIGETSVAIPVCLPWLTIVRSNVSLAVRLSPERCDSKKSLLSKKILQQLYKAADLHHQLSPQLLSQIRNWEENDIIPLLPSGRCRVHSWKALKPTIEL